MKDMKIAVWIVLLVALSAVAMNGAAGADAEEIQKLVSEINTQENLATFQKFAGNAGNYEPWLKKNTVKGEPDVSHTLKRADEFQIYIEGARFCMSQSDGLTASCSSDSPWIGLSYKQIKFIHANIDYISDALSDGRVGFFERMILMFKWYAS